MTPVSPPIEYHVVVQPIFSRDESFVLGVMTGVAFGVCVGIALTCAVTGWLS